MTLFAILVASLLGSPHCAAMCGGFVLAASDDQPRAWMGLGAYNLGRLCTYMVLGSLAGLLGSSIDSLGVLSGIGHLAAILIGIGLILYGTLKLISGDRPIGATRGLHRFSTEVYRNVVGKLPRKHPALRAYGIGLLSTFLPCGWLYAFVAVAAATGSPFHGAVAMAIFWAGTFPLMVMVGGFARELLRRWGAQLPAVSATLLIVAGFFSIASHLGWVGEHAHHHHHSMEQSGGMEEQMDQ